MSESISDTFYPVIRTPVDQLGTYIANNLPEGISSSISSSVAIEEFIALIETYMSLNANVAIPLQNMSVDYETNKAEMMSILANESNTWSDTVIAGTGQTLLEMVATALTYMQFNIVRSAQEVMMDTMTLINSIYAGVRHLGQRIQRRLPGTCQATLILGTNTTGLTIPPFTVFTVGSVYYFNRTPIVFGSNITTLTDINLYEGQIYNTTFTSNGGAYQSFVFGNSDYTISDVDVAVTINSTQWTPTTFADYFNVGLWEYNNTAQVFSNYTTSDGNVEIDFGNNINGAIPASNAAIIVTFASTSGAAGNIDLTGTGVTSSGIQGLTGTITSPTINGTNPLSPGSYKVLGPGRYAAKYRAVTRPDYVALATAYPGVVDALFLGQQDFAPENLTYMMVVKAVLLTTSTWGTETFNTFSTWLSNLGIANVIYLQDNPTATSISISANVYCFNNSDLASIENSIVANLTAAFTPTLGSLGYNWYFSDIEKLILQTNSTDIDYIEVVSPSGDTTLTSLNQYITLSATPVISMNYSTRNPRSQ